MAKDLLWAAQGSETKRAGQSRYDMEEGASTLRLNSAKIPMRGAASPSTNLDGDWRRSASDASCYGTPGPHRLQGVRSAGRAPTCTIWGARPPPQL